MTSNHSRRQSTTLSNPSNPIFPTSRCSTPELALALAVEAVEDAEDVELPLADATVGDIIPPGLVLIELLWPVAVTTDEPEASVVVPMLELPGIGE